MNPAFHRYARALYGLSQDRGVVAEVCQDLSDFQTLVQQHRPLAMLLERPFVGSDPVSRSLMGIARLRGYQEITTSFLGLMARRGRSRDILKAVHFFMDLKNQQEGKIALTVTSAFPFSHGESEEIQQTLTSLMGRKPEVIFTHDKNLLGGMVIRHPSWVVDGSLQGQLKRIGHALKGHTLHHS